MDRFVWTSGLLEINETLVIQQRGVRIYDGEEKVGRPRGPAGPRSLGPRRATGLARRASPRRRHRPAPRAGSDAGPQVPGARTAAAPLRSPKSSSGLHNLRGPRGAPALRRRVGDAARPPPWVVLEPPGRRWRRRRRPRLPGALRGLRPCPAERPTSCLRGFLKREGLAVFTLRRQKASFLFVNFFLERNFERLFC